MQSLKKTFYKHLSNFLQYLRCFNLELFLKVGKIYCFHLKMFLKTSSTVSKTTISQITSSILCIVSKTNKSLLISYILSIFMATCVEEEPPKGGTEDKKPPMLVEKLCNPNNTNKQTNFKGKKLIFVFDKDIKINNAYEEIKIIPSIKGIAKTTKKKGLKTLVHVDKNNPEIDKKASSDKKDNNLKKGILNPNIKTKKQIQSQKMRYGYTYWAYGNKGIIIKPNKPLQKDTVYVVHFGKSISSKYGDITNENLSVTFTTGPKISNLSVKGKVVDIMNGEGIKNIYVALYKSSRKQNIFNSSPDYFTKTDSKGNYDIKYVKANKYLLMASNSINFEGINKNLGIHTLGFMSKPIDINAKMDKNIQYKIHAVKRYLDPLKIEKTEIKDGRYSIAFNNPIKNYKIDLQGDGSQYKVYSTLSEDKKVVTVFNWFKNSEGQILQQLEENRNMRPKITITDRKNSVLEENIELAFGKDFAALENLKLKISPNNSYVGKNGKIKIEVSLPFKKLDITKVYFKDAKGNKLYFDKKKVSYNVMHNIITLKRSLLENKKKLLKTPNFVDENSSKIDGKMPNNENGNSSKGQTIEDILSITLYDLILEKGFVTTIDNQQSESESKKFILETNKSTGIIHGDLNLGIPNYKIQLLNKKFEVLQEVKRTNFNNEPYIFKNVPPGEYSIVVIELNKKMEWFAGDIDTLTPPGAVYLYHDKNDFVKVGPGIKMKLKTMYIKLSDAS